MTLVQSLSYDAATIEVREIMKKGYQVALLLAFGALFAAFAFNPPKSSGDWASWVQAWGSIAAICAAIWVAFDQHQKSERRAIAAADEEVNNFLSGVREELRISWMVYMSQVGEELAKTKAGEPVTFWWPPPVDAFKVYGATVGVIGRVRDDEIRQQIISTYVVVGGLLVTWETHNRLLTELNEAEEALRSPSGDATYDQRKSARVMKMLETLLGYSDQLRTHQLQAVSLIESTISAIDRHFARDA